jgi:TPR repeat protein
LEVERVRKNIEILHAEAVKWIKKAATTKYGDKAGVADALFFLADCYGNGTLGLTIDHDRAFGYYLQATKQGHAASYYRVGVCYEVGAGAKKDAARAMQFFRKSATLGDTAAMYKIGMTLIQGSLGQSKNLREGVNYLKRAADHGDETAPFALFELAELYSDPHVNPAYGIAPVTYFYTGSSLCF